MLRGSSSAHRHVDSIKYSLDGRRPIATAEQVLPKLIENSASLPPRRRIHSPAQSHCMRMLAVACTMCNEALRSVTGRYESVTGRYGMLQSVAGRYGTL